MIPQDVKEIHIDIETYSEVDLKKCGGYKYCGHESFEIQLMTVGYTNPATGNRAFITFEPTNGKPIPEEVIDLLHDPKVIKYAWHAKFERVCLGAWLGVNFDPKGWRCVMVMAGFAGIPQSLGKAANIMDLPNKKLAGATLINYFSKPCKPTKSNDGRLRNQPWHAPDKWASYIKYNRVDVATEMDALKWIILAGVQIPDEEWDAYELDQRVNDKGVQVDIQFVNAVNEKAVTIKSELAKKICDITGIDSARSVQKLMVWFADNGLRLPSLTKDVLASIYNNVKDRKVKEVIELRLQSATTTTDKYKAAIRCVDDDGRIRGMFAFNGAYRTGRFAGRLLQPQNLSRIHFTNDIKELNRIRESAKFDGSIVFNAGFDRPINILGQLIRTVFIGAPGNVIGAADYSAIEARVLAWLAGEQWKLEVFNTHGKIYEATASRLFSIPIESVTKDSDYRQKGKVAELAFGYGGKLGAVENMGFIKDGTIHPDDVDPLVDRYRDSNRNIVQLWSEYENAALRAVSLPGRSFIAGKCEFYSTGNHLFITLPSGRELAYYQPSIRPNKWGKDALHYMGENDISQWVTLSTWGGKLTENICQAIARDIMVHSQKLCTDAGYNLVMHVHDENVFDEPKERAYEALKHICELMAIVPDWATGLPLRAEGFVSDYYRK